MSSCANYPAKTAAGLEAFERRQFSSATQVYDQGAEEEGVDQLLYLFDRGMVKHTAGQYEESIKDFLQADRLSEIKDYTALAVELATIVTNDRITHYKGEEFENVLVSTYLALNFAILGKRESALVECRRVNRKLERLRAEAKRTYSLNAFAQYLSGVLYEQEGNWNSAYVDYKKAWDLKPEFTPLRQDLLIGAIKSNSESERDRWERSLKAKEADFNHAAKIMRETGSLIVIYQNGFAPQKVESDNWSELPAYRKRFNKNVAANVYIDGKFYGRTELLYDIEDVAFKNLEQKYATYIAKRATGLAAKVIIGNQVEKATGSRELGTLTQIFLLLVSRPDLRAWLTLPQNLQMARLRLPPGNYQVGLKLIDQSGKEGELRDLGERQISKPGSIVIANYRSLND